jgi:similar to stage IV sporulation protein
MIFSLVNFLRGYLIIEAVGGFGERFINLLVKNNICVWSVERVSADTIRMKIRVSGFKRIRPAVRKTRVKIRVVKKCGLSMFLHRHRRRKAFFAGIFLFMLILVVLTSFIWSVEITGLEKIDKKTIINQLKACGIYVGVLKYNHSPFEIKREALLNIPELAWINVEIRGTRALVQVKERSEKPEIVDKDKPCNIIAAKDGVIEKAIVKNGVPVKKEGDVVKKGDLLVSGTADSKTGGTRLIHSQADIIAFTWYEETGEFPLEKTVTEKTGEAEKRYMLAVGGKEFTVFPFRKIRFQEYTEKKNTRILRLWGDFYLPLSFVSSVCEETRTIKEPLSGEEAAQYFGDKLFERIENSFMNDTEVIDKNYTYEINEGKIKVCCTVKCREQIGVLQEIYVGV